MTLLRDGCEALVRWRAVGGALWSPAGRGWLLVFAFALCAFELVLDFRIVPPTSIDWIFSFASDTTQYYLSFAYYRNSAWHFPLTGIDTMLYPLGGSLMQSDALPLLAIPFKVLNFLLPTDFQFYGLWLLGCVVLSAVFAKLLLERLLTERPLIWAGIVIITLAPPFVARFLHCHLAAHWMLLAAFWTVLEERRLPKRRIWLLSTAALFVQPYLFAIVSGVLVAAFWVHRRERRSLVVAGAVWAALIGLSAWVLGYFALQRSAAGQAQRFQADLMTFFSPMGTSAIVPDASAQGAFTHVWDGRAEGFAYLGLGGMVLFAFLVVTLVARASRKTAPRGLHPAWPALGVVSLALACFAWTPSPIVFGHPHSGIPQLTELIEPLAARFRSAGRFVWPLFYFVLLFGLQAAEGWVLRLKRPHASLAFASMLVLAQAVDVGPWLYARGRRPAVTHPARLAAVPTAVRARITSKTRYLVFDPPVQRVTCGGPDRWQPRSRYYPLAVLGARRGLIVNTDFRGSSRLSHAEILAVCRYTGEIARLQPPRDDTVVVTPLDLPKAVPLEKHRRHRAHRRRARR